MVTKSDYRHHEGYWSHDSLFGDAGNGPTSVTRSRLVSIVASDRPPLPARVSFGGGGGSGGAAPHHPAPPPRTLRAQQSAARHPDLILSLMIAISLGLVSYHTAMLATNYAHNNTWHL